MESSISQSRFTFPIDIVRPKSAARFELWAPKLKRRVTLFDPFHVKLCTYLESNPRMFHPHLLPSRSAKVCVFWASLLSNPHIT